MQKIDFKKTLKPLYAPKPGDFHPVDVPPMRFLQVEGHGNPNTVPAYGLAVEALYATSYALKFASKFELGQDYVVPPLEGLWWAADPAAFTQRRKDAWHWIMMIMVPDFVEAALVDDAMQKAEARINGLPESLKLADLDEGQCLQKLHIGSYDDEAPALEHLHDKLMPTQGLTFNGPHHEIYLSDPRRVAPAKLRTILRQPVRPV